jgi:hypothetical protein
MAIPADISAAQAGNALFRYALAKYAANDSQQKGWRDWLQTALLRFDAYRNYINRHVVNPEIISKLNTIQQEMKSTLLAAKLDITKTFNREDASSEITPVLISKAISHLNQLANNRLYNPCGLNDDGTLIQYSQLEIIISSFLNRIKSANINDLGLDKYWQAFQKLAAANQKAQQFSQHLLMKRMILQQAMENRTRAEYLQDALDNFINAIGYGLSNSIKQTVAVSSHGVNSICYPKQTLTQLLSLLRKQGSLSQAMNWARHYPFKALFGMAAISTAAYFNLRYIAEKSHYLRFLTPIGSKTADEWSFDNTLPIIIPIVSFYLLLGGIAQASIDPKQQPIDEPIEPPDFDTPGQALSDIRTQHIRQSVEISREHAARQFDTMAAYIAEQRNINPHFEEDFEACLSSPQPKLSREALHYFQKKYQRFQHDLAVFYDAFERMEDHYRSNDLLRVLATSLDIRTEVVPQNRGAPITASVFSLDLFRPRHVTTVFQQQEGSAKLEGLHLG